VELCRQLATQRPDAFTPDLVTSLGALGSILKQDESSMEAAAAFFVEGIARLSPLFTALPQAYGPLMQSLAKDYLEACRKAGVEPDRELLGPVAEVFQRLNEGA
jgi:hypothetical protein